MSLPQEPFEFIEMHGFANDWTVLGYSDDNLFNLQDLLTANPRMHPVVPGTGGLRKMRFAGARANVGKRGGARVCFAEFPEFGIILLIMAYAKNRKDTMAAKEKKDIRRFLDHCRERFASGKY